MAKYSLIGINGNAYCLMAYVCNALEIEKEAMDLNQDSFENLKADYLKDAMSGTYNHLLCVSYDLIAKINESIGENLNEDDRLEVNPNMEK